ncbi:MAG: protein kinase [Verrucomicrobiaceae bacterium]|nr:protein kinase [Verrucomicrobiaceae bacterium]
MSTPKDDSLDETQAMNAFGVAMHADKPKQWQPPRPEELQEMLPGYKIDKLVGRGGMGAVYRGVQTTLDRKVAIKILPPGLGEHDPAFVERFLNEARLMAKLAHPNVVTIYDSGETKDGQLYYVMELMDGTDVSRMIAEKGRLSVEQARAICLRVCDALAAAHELGIVHRDIKPANVLVGTKNVVKVGDFGLARLEDAHSGLTRTGFMVGTLDFLAPEAMTPGVEVDGRADLYAVGVMLYQMLTGSLPRGAFKPASQLVPGLDRHFDSVISRAMQTKPDDRYASAAQMRHDLEQLSVVLNFRDTADTTMAVPVGRLTAENIAQRPVTKISSVSPKSGEQAISPTQSAAKAKKKRWLSEAKTRWAATLLAIVLSAAAGYVALRRVGQGVVTLSYDLPFLVHRPGGAGDVCMVYLEEKVGDNLDRKVQPALLDKLAAAGARAVVYDVIFEANSADPALDAAFAESMKKYRAGGGVVMLAAGREVTQQAGVAMERLIIPNDTLLDAADDYGLVALVHDDRFTVRELIAGTRDEASLTWKTAQKLGAPLDEANRLDDRWINYTGPHDAIPSVSAKNVLDGVDEAFFRGKIVVIGGKPGIVSPKLGEDLFSTPFHRLDRRGNVPLMSGVEVQANMLVNLLRGNWLVRSGDRADLLFVLFIGLAAGWAFSRLRPFTGFLLAFAAVVLLSLAGVLAVHFASVWFPWSVAALVQLPVALVAGTGAHFTSSGTSG